MTKDEITKSLRTFLSEECYLDGAGIAAGQSLFGSGTLNSLDLLDLCAYLERDLGIEIKDHEVSADALDNLDLITDFVLSKKN